MSRVRSRTANLIKQEMHGDPPRAKGRFIPNQPCNGGPTTDKEGCGVKGLNVALYGTPSQVSTERLQSSNPVQLFLTKFFKSDLVLD